MIYINSVADYILWNNLSITAGWNSEDVRCIYGSESKRFRPRLKREDMVMIILFIEPSFR